MEGGAQARRPHNKRPASRVGDTGVALPIERTPEDSVVAKFAEYLSSTIFILDSFFV